MVLTVLPVRMPVLRVLAANGVRMPAHMQVRTIRMSDRFVWAALCVDVRNRYSPEQQLHNHDNHRDNTHFASFPAFTLGCILRKNNTKNQYLAIC